METEDRTLDLNKMQKFEDLNVWEESVKLSVDIYKVLKNGTQKQVDIFMLY